MPALELWNSGPKTEGDYSPLKSIHWGCVISRVFLRVGHPVRRHCSFLKAIILGAGGPGGGLGCLHPECAFHRPWSSVLRRGSASMSSLRSALARRGAHFIRAFSDVRCVPTPHPDGTQVRRSPGSSRVALLAATCPHVETVAVGDKP